MPRANDPAAVDDALMEKYEQDYLCVERWNTYGLGGAFPGDLVEDETFRNELASPEGRELVASWARTYRLLIRQLMCCKPREDYITSELIQLDQQATHRLNELSRLASDHVSRQRRARGSSASHIPSLAWP